MMNPHKITAEFEKALCDYTGAPYAVAVDNCSNALLLALYYEFNYRLLIKNPIVSIPRHTYPSVPCEIIHAGGKVEFYDNGTYQKGAYQLKPTNVWDSALSFTRNMYVANSHMCLSFTGPYKHLKLGKGGAILTDDKNAAAWFKRARFSGRSECSYHDDDFDAEQHMEVSHSNENIDGHGFAAPIAGWNFYMMPEIAARGLLLMAQFYDRDGKPKHNEDLCLPYPDLSKFKIFQQ
jgi:dTDP-4-amino-4,6-dideoxygalactose transaminase